MQAKFVTVMVGFGETTIVRVIGVPKQVVVPHTNVGVMVIVAVWQVVTAGATPDISPVPLAAIPVAVLSLVQAYVTPVVVPNAGEVNAIAIAPPEQTAAAVAATSGTGVTVTSTVIGKPAQLVQGAVPT